MSLNAKGTEMAEFPRRWKHRIDIKQHLGDDTSPAGVRKAAAGVLAELRKVERHFEDDASLTDLMLEFGAISEEDDADCDDFNGWLDELYDWADGRRVWLGLQS